VLPAFSTTANAQRCDRSEDGPVPAIYGVVRWRLIDLAQWVFEEFRVSISKQTLSRELRTMGFRKLSARPRARRRSRPGFKNVWPAPSASDFIENAIISLLQRIRPRARVPVLIKLSASSAIF
jgi:Winged helix-turn helix